ncbi:MAG: VWA domain-containing protein [Chloroflexi bacterium]|nr:VWA domain-containing protein [Chloroflexota bacterium]
MNPIPISFTHPWFLVLLAALPVFYVLARWRRRVPRGPWPVALWLRLGVALLVVLALAGLRLPAPAKSVATVFVVDLSESVPADIREGAKHWVRQALAEQRADDLAAIVTFGREARVELPLGKVRDHAEWQEPPPGNTTDIGRAIELAASLLPPAASGPLRRLVLLSDGNETSGDAHRSLLRPHLRDVEVAVVPLPQRLQDSAITGLSVPPALREGEPADIRVTMLAPATQEATLRIWARGGEIEQLLAERTLPLEGGPNEFAVTAPELPKGSWTIQATLTVDGDSRPENNESWAFTVVGEPARVVVVDGEEPSPALRDAFAAAKIGVDVWRPRQVPVQVEQLLPYEAVILNNVHAGDLREPQMDALRRYVAERGRGLVVVGGERTFGLGDYTDTPLEEALPVTVQPPERDQKASLALVLVVDRSGSMQTPAEPGNRGTSRMELAKEGAIQAVEALQEGDQVGIIAFDYTAKWIVEIRPINGRGDVQAIADRIATITPDGGTDIFAGMDLAYKGMQQIQARVKHVIVLTDGEQGSEAPFAVLINAMRRAGITLSTVGVSSDIGSRAQADMQSWARRGQGRYYFTNSARDVPQIMTQEARLAGKSHKQEHDFTPRLATAASAVRGLVPADFPQLHGYVRVTAKPSAEILLTSNQEEVILAQWQYGLGRAVVWTADAEGPWSKDWVGTEQFQHLWPQTVRWTMPAPLSPEMLVTTRSDGAHAVVRVEAFEPTGEPRNFLRTVVDVADPQGTGRQISLPQVAPGRYEGRFPLDGPGVYFMNVAQHDERGTLVAQQMTGHALPQLPEFQLTQENRVLMERLAADTGGPELNLPKDAWRRDTRHALQPQEVWNYLLIAALVLFVGDVAVRRLRPGLADLALVRGFALRGYARLQPHLRLPRVQLHPLQATRRR